MPDGVEKMYLDLKQSLSRKLVSSWFYIQFTCKLFIPFFKQKCQRRSRFSFSGLLVRQSKHFKDIS